ncbi:ATPase family AAA domain-containing protein 5b [Mastacembelus armatus]|uniref:ATPase family AAA domain containing 5b n=1 Tax=Mastacembelus armatus TaxID=205130 RepID=A0A3Q3KNG0_9TELE|nr:ATPase family AAA domain-containing protein 5-like [Mastacembelus armatus]
MRNKVKRSRNCRDPSNEKLQTSPAAQNIPDAASAAKHINIAPVFTCTTQQGRSKWMSDGKRDHPAERKQTSVLPPQCNDLQRVKSENQLSTSAVCHLAKTEEPLQSTCRGPSALHICLDEIQTSNPAFPVQTVFDTLQKKANKSPCFEPTAHDPPCPTNHLKEKRKRAGDLSCERVTKRHRCIVAAEAAAGHVPTQEVQGSVSVKRSTRLSRTYRLRKQSGSLAGPVNNCEPTSDSQSPVTGDTTHRESCVEGVLWTDKYSPQQSSEVIGNSASVNKLHSWLKKWKLKADSDEKRKMEERRTKENSKDPWDCGDFQGEAGVEDDEEEPLCNTTLITGPAGVGKTAAVYACAQELGFKVFEVNSSSQRSGRHVLAQLKEATQSHLVETSGKDPLKPAYFNNYTTSCTPKSETLPGKTVHPKNLKSSSKKRAAQNGGCSGSKGKANPATVTLTNYFKMKARADHLHIGGCSPSEKPDSKKLDIPSLVCDQTMPENKKTKKTATSLILFEEVDVIFDDDAGFLAAVKTFMTTTKRPVILTTNDASFRERFNGNLEEIIFKAPPEMSICSYLQLVGLAENVRLDCDDVSSLLRLTRGDVRHCLLQLQLWVHGGRGRASQSAGLLKEPTQIKYSNDTEGKGSLDSQPPPCETGCTANMLGLYPLTQIQLLNHLKCQDWSETDMNKLLRPLAESWRRSVPLLYSNLELLLPIGTRGTSVHCQDKVRSGLQRELAPCDTDLHIQQTNGNISPKASSINSKCVKISRLSRRKRITKDTTVPSTDKPQRISLPLKEAHSAAPGLSDKAEQIAAKVATSCFSALTDFFDLMSYLDATLPAAAPLVSGSCKPQAFVWPGAEIKDGLSDEVSDEDDRSWSQEWLLNVQAAVEGLGCHRCCRRVSEAWIEAQNYRRETKGEEWGRLVDILTLPASSKRESLCFGFQPLCAPSVSQQRYELSQTLLGSKSFSLLGNRQAVTVDYLPALRSICRFQKARQLNKKPFRCLNYLSSLDLSKSTIQLLAEDFSTKYQEKD